MDIWLWGWWGKMRIPLLFVLLIDLDFTRCFSSPSLALQLHPRPGPRTPGHTPRATLTFSSSSSTVLGPRPHPQVPWFPLSHPQLISMAACATWILAQLPGPLPSPSSTGSARGLLYPGLASQSSLASRGSPAPRHSPWTWSGSALLCRGASLIPFSLLHLHFSLSENYLQFLLHKASGFDLDPRYFESAWL